MNPMQRDRETFDKVLEILKIEEDELKTMTILYTVRRLVDVIEKQTEVSKND